MVLDYTVIAEGFGLFFCVIICELSASCLDLLMIKIQTARRKLTLSLIRRAPRSQEALVGLFSRLAGVPIIANLVPLAFPINAETVVHRR